MAKAALKQEGWGSQIGVILAVAGSAVGIGNFLRFPGQAALYGGGAFMVAYLVSLVLLGVPMAWVEWTLGRKGGGQGFSSFAGVLSRLWKNPIAKHVGAVGVLIVLGIYMYYAYIEAWLLGYSINFLADGMTFDSPDEAVGFWLDFIGFKENGSAWKMGIDSVAPYLVGVLLLNFYFIFRGVSKGVELFCKYTVPAIIGIGIIVLIKVLTLGTPDGTMPERSIDNGLGYLWNPTKLVLEVQDVDTGKWVEDHEVLGDLEYERAEAAIAKNPEHVRMREVGLIEQLKKPKLWLAAASQVFFSLNVGFGVIIVYASYLKKDDDVVVSSLCAASANTFCEVVLGGLITIPAAFAFLGLAGIAGQGLFCLGFHALPMVFAQMPMGNLFGFLFFFLLFLAAMSSVLAMLQASSVFLKEALGLGHKAAVSLLFVVSTAGVLAMSWFSEGATMMGTYDFWVGNFLVYVVSMVMIWVFGWVIGIEAGFEEAHKGAAVKIPGFFKIIIKWISPVFLLGVFVLWLVFDVLGIEGEGMDSRITDLVGPEADPLAQAAFISLAVLGLLLCLLAGRAKRFKN